MQHGIHASCAEGKMLSFRLTSMQHATGTSNSLDTTSRTPWIFLKYAKYKTYGYIHVIWGLMYLETRLWKENILMS